jgi:hypothetical protein
MGVVFLNKCLDILREKRWYDKVVAMGNRSWRGKGLPPGFDFDTLRGRWATMASGLTERLQELSAPDFKFQEFARGEEEIRETVSESLDATTGGSRTDVDCSCIG